MISAKKRYIKKKKKIQHYAGYIPKNEIVQQFDFLQYKFNLVNTLAKTMIKVHLKCEYIYHQIYSDCYLFYKCFDVISKTFQNIFFFFTIKPQKATNRSVDTCFQDRNVYILTLFHF